MTLPIQIVHEDIVERLPGGQRTAWPLERLQALEVAWNDGASAKECANKFGTTRNAIIGAIDRFNGRYGLEFAFHPSRTGAGRKPRIARTRVHVASVQRARNRQYKAPLKTSRLNNAWGLTVAGQPPQPTELKPVADLRPLNKTLLELEAKQCRWPVADDPTLFCGLETERGSYCPAHGKI